jgi:hypothetical protein
MDENKPVHVRQQREIQQNDPEFGIHYKDRHPLMLL